MRRLDDIRASHWQRSAIDECGSCQQVWPCDSDILLARLEQAEAALARLVEFEPLGYIRMTDFWQCRLCAAQNISEVLVPHFLDCPWAQARALLKTDSR